MAMLRCVACAGQALIGVAQPFIIPVDLPPGKPAPREHFLLSPLWVCKCENTLRVWKLGDSVASVKTIPGNGRGSYKHRNTPGGIAVTVECLQGMEVWTCCQGVL